MSCLHYCPDQISDKETWLEYLQTKPELRKRVVEGLYHSPEILRIIKSMLRRYNCKPDELMDILQQAVLKFNEQLEAAKFKGDASLSTYFIGIVRGICRNWSRMKCRTLLLCEHNLLDETVDYGDLSWDVLEKECKELLHLELAKFEGRKLAVLQMWLEGYRMREIAETLELGTEANARKWKYRATQELIRNVKESKEAYQTLKRFWMEVV